MFSTAIQVKRSESSWYEQLDTKYYLYPVHVSLSFIFTPTLASALYLLFMRYLNRNYGEVFRLVGSIGTDMELSDEENQIFFVITAIEDFHPDSVACMCRLSLHVADSPVTVPWYIPERVAQLVRLRSRLSVSCLMALEEERRLLHLAHNIQEKLILLEDTITKNQHIRDHFQKEGYNLDRSRKSRSITELLKSTLREKLNYRATSDELSRLLGQLRQYRKKLNLPEYSLCLLHNRRLMIDAEFSSKMADSTTTTPQSTSLSLRVPKRGDDNRWLFYRQYDPASITMALPATPFVNDVGKQMTMSKVWDYWYCNSGQRICKCKPSNCGGGTTCGGGSGDGCPCPSCEKFNKEHLHRIRLLVGQLDNRNPSRPMTFMDIFGTLRTVLGAFESRQALAKEYFKNGVTCYQSKLKRVHLRDGAVGFWFFYELLTHSKMCRVSKTECGSELAQLMFPFYNDAQDVTSALGHALHYILRSPQCCETLPRFPKKGRGPDISDAVEKIREFAARTVEEFPLPPDPASMARYSNKTDVENTGRQVINFSPRPSQRDATLPLTRTLILPTPLNTGCSRRLATLPHLDHLVLLGNEKKLLAVTQAQLDELIHVPLQSVLADSILVRRTRSELGLPLISEELAFDLSKHPDASKTVARDMLARLTKESKAFASSQNDVAIPKIVGLTCESEIKALVTGAVTDTRMLSKVQDELTTLRTALQTLRAQDTEFVAYAQVTVVRTANHVPSGTVLASLMSLRASARREATLTLDYLLSSLCSTTADHEWRQLNPFLSRPACDAIMAILTLTVLRANRIGHINRVLETVSDLEALLSKVKKVDEHGKSLIDAISASVQQKADSLASQLVVSRCYVNRSDHSFDPRFLIFEFTWNLVMRRRQFELVQDMYSSITRNESVVKQMIMGAGKTTVVSPMLALMLANGENLVIQVVPPALLDFTRAVLRTTFSSVLPKQIFTFACDRTTEVDSEILLKFDHATRCRGIVVTTPSSIKSIFLKYIEGLDRLIDPARSKSEREALEKEAQDHQKLLAVWRDAILVMDEVDMLLHPLKSELNFPIGPKNDLDFTPLRWKLPIHLIDAVFYYHTKRVATFVKESPEVNAILSRFRTTVKAGLEKNYLQEMPHLILLSLEFYETQLKPILIEWLLLFIKGQHFLGLTDDETTAYMKRRPQTNEQPELVQKVESLEAAHVKLLNLSFEWINSYLPHVLQKIDRVTFGIMNNDDMVNARRDRADMPRSRFVTSIPFVGKDMPSPSSEFAHPDIVIGLTVLAYRYEGLRDMDFDEIIADVFASVEKEVGRYSQRRTNLMYNRWVTASGGQLLTTFDYSAVAPMHQLEVGSGMQPSESYSFDEDHPKEIVCVLPLKLMRQANAIEQKKLFRLFRRTPEVIHWYLCEHIFPEYMRHQEVKLSASGQELGGDMIFKRRIGFSGTPSSLLPIELGQCGYEMGTDGQLIHTLTSPSVMAYTVVEPGWTVRSLLDFVGNAQPPFHSLIDTGALITGMSNEQVAQYLLKNGLSSMEGVVFLDELDRKMILVRATGRVLRLAECGIPKVKRFAFYDQIHTTGMDIDHTPNAQAVQTLGKDMTFRDFSQGAYRMRGIGQGQTVHLLIIPEVYDLISKVLFVVKQQRPINAPGQTAGIIPVSKPRQHNVLTAVAAWLLVNSIRSEHVQHNQLRVQSCSNVWRKEAYARLQSNMDGFSPLLPEPPAAALSALKVFKEDVDYTVTRRVPQPRLFSESLESYVVKHKDFISANGATVVQSIVDGARREDEVDAPVIDVEMVQEQEEEREREQEQEKQQEIEIEKFIDLDYNREEEAAVPWRVEALRSLASAKHFYKLSEFHLYKRPSLSFPDSVMLSRNYYSIAWSGHRRIKNVIITLEWIPSIAELKDMLEPSNDYNTIDRKAALAQLIHTISMLTTHQGNQSSATLKDLLLTALHFAEPNHPRWAEVIEMLQPTSAEGKFDLESAAAIVLGVLNSNLLREEQQGRFTVAVSLAEAETLRRVLHYRKCRQQPVVEGSDTAFALRIAPSQNALMDVSGQFPQAPQPYQVTKNYHALRFFDCELQYTDAEVGLLLRALHNNAQKGRQIFFQQVISCRRRARQRWERTPISLIFFLRDAFTLLHQRTVGLCMYREVQSLDLNLGDAFVAFNPSGTGALAPEEVWGAMRFCRLDLTCDEVLDFIDIADAQRDGTIQYSDFLYVLRGVREADDDVGVPSSEEQQGKKLPDVVPHGGHELKEARAIRSARLREEEEEAARILQAEDRRVMEEIDQEQIRQEADVYQHFPNPKFSSASSSITFDFGSTTQVPQLVSTWRNYAVRNVPRAEPNPSALLVSNAALRVSLRGLNHEISNITNKSIREYVLSAEFRLPLCGRGKKKKLSALDYIERLEIASWSLSGFSFVKIGLPFEDDLLTVKRERREEAKKAGKLENKNASKADDVDAPGEQHHDPHREANSSTEETDDDDVIDTSSSSSSNSVGVPRRRHDEEVKRPLPRASSQASSSESDIQRRKMIAAQRQARLKNPSAEPTEDDSDSDDSSSEADSEESFDVGDSMFIFKEPMPTFEGIIGRLRTSDQNILIAAYDKRQSTIINGCTYEWSRLADPRFPDGWVVSSKEGTRLLNPQRLVVHLTNDGKVAMSVEEDVKVSPPYGAIMDSNFDPEAQFRLWEKWGFFARDGDNDDDGEEESEEDEVAAEGWDNDEDQQQQQQGGKRMKVQGDVEDLMLAIRRMRALERGDKVKRHPTFWQHEDEDGGEGTIGTVQRVTPEDEVEVVWPNKKKGLYCWGKNGIFELIKVDKSTLASAGRTPENDDRHKDDILTHHQKGTKLQCKGCFQKTFTIAQMYMCNACEVMICETCFENGVHEEHEFTEAAFYVPKKVDKDQTDDAAGMNLLGLEDDADDVAAAAAAAAEISAAGGFEFFPRTITDSICGDVRVGCWARVKVPWGTVRRHSIGLVFGITGAEAHCEFFVNKDKSTARKAGPIVDLVRVKPYLEGVIAPAEHISKVLRCQWSPNLWLLDSAAVSRCVFQEGDCVCGRFNDAMHVGVVMAVLPKKSYSVFFHSASQGAASQGVLSESKLMPCFHKQALVRFKNAVTYPTFGWPSGIAANRRYRVTGKIISHNIKESQVSCSVEFDGGSRHEVATEDLELVQSAAWVLFPPDSSAFSILPRSCEIIIDRVHTEGNKVVKFALGKKHYRAEFPAYQLFNETHEGDVPAGHLARFPPKQWTKPQKAKAFDDGYWHVLSIVVKGNSAKAICDGEMIPLIVTGNVEVEVSDYRNEDDFGHVKRETGNSSSGPKWARDGNEWEEDGNFNGLFGDDDDQSGANQAAGDPVTTAPAAVPAAPASDGSAEKAEPENPEEEVEEAEKTKPKEAKDLGEFLPLCLAAPLLVYSTDSTGGGSSDEVEDSFPRRYISWLDIRWGSSVSLDVIVQWHRKINDENKWICFNCRCHNARQVSKCEDCSEPRQLQADQRLDRRNNAKFRAALLYSKEASQLRSKLNNKLRALFQAQLDSLSNPVEELAAAL